MKDKAVQLASKAREIYMRLEMRQKIILGALLVITFVLLVWLVHYSTNVEYALLFGKLSPEDANDAIKKLEELKVEYKIQDQGQSIYVPADKVYETRIKLSSEGIGTKNEGIGFEIFDKNQLGMTEFVQNVNYRRALEGELQRTIQSINGVDFVRVHFVIPEEKIFKEDQQQPSASVLLKLKNKLAEKQITGISNLISSAVEGLDPSRVTIVDQDGNVLTERFDDSISGMSSSQLKLQAQVENAVSTKVQSMLDNILGPDNSVVRVSAELSFDQVETTTERYDPEGQVVRSEEVETNSQSNMKDSATVNNEHQITNYEINSSVQHIMNSVGSIKRLTVSVNVNYRLKVKEQAGKTVKEYQVRTPQELAQIDALVRNAVGYNATRGDQIVVNSMQFDDTSIQLEKTQEEQEKRQHQLIDIGIKAAVIVILLVLIFVLVSQMKRLFTPAVLVEEQEDTVRPIIAQGSPETEGFYPEGEEGLPMGEGKIAYTFRPMKDIEIEQTEAVILQEAVQKFVIENPEVAVRLIKTWIMESQANKGR